MHELVVVKSLSNMPMDESCMKVLGFLKILEHEKIIACMICMSWNYCMIKPITSFIA
jgi:hypothetical protein